jgi:hypothetical protein
MSKGAAIFPHIFILRVCAFDGGYLKKDHRPLAVKGGAVPLPNEVEVPERDPFRRVI